MKTAHKTLLALLITLIMLALWICPHMIVIIQPGTCGVPVRFGAVQKLALYEGLHFVNPITTRVEMVNLKVQKNQLDAGSATADLQDVRATVAINYSVDPEKAPELLQTVGQLYYETVMAPAILEVFKAQSANYTAENLIKQRSQVSEAMVKSLQEKLRQRGINVVAFSIVEFQFSQAFNTAVEQKTVAEQEALRTQRELERTKYEAEKVVAKAQGEADAKLALAKAEAEAMRIKTQAITTPILILEVIQKWDGKLPATILGNVPQPVFPIQDIQKMKSEQSFKLNNFSELQETSSPPGT